MRHPENGAARAERRGRLSTNQVAAVAAIVAVGGFLRLQQPIGASFALGDGGLFHAAVEGVRASGGLPAFIDYNGEVPFVYPPLGFLLGAGAASIPGIDAMTALRVLPPVLAILALALVPWAVGTLLKSRWIGITAAALVALMPQSYDHLLAAGGLTRASGVVLALLAIGVAADDRSSARRGAVLGFVLGLAALSHPQVAMFALATVAFAWWLKRSTLGWREVIAAGAVAAITLAPWLVVLASREQVPALLAGSQRFDPVVGAVSLIVYPAMQAMHGGIPNVAVALSLVGVAANVFLRRWWILGWLLVVHLLNAPPFVSALAWAVAGAVGIVSVVELARHGTATSPRAIAAGLGAVMVVGVLSAAASPADPGSKQQPLLPPQVDAARSIGELPPGTSLAVVTSQTWGNDIFGEWLPTLSGHRVVTTPQGSEWLGRNEFARRVASHEAAEACHRRTSECVAAAIQAGDVPATHVVIPRGSVSGPRGSDECCPALVQSIRADDRFEVVLDLPGALVIAWRSVPASASTGEASFAAVRSLDALGGSGR